jgi:hypothetical protein
MYLYLYLYLYLMPHAAPFKKLFKKPNVSSLASKHASILGLYLDLNLSLFLPRLHPPGQSPVCHPHGRIVVPAVPDHYM